MVSPLKIKDIKEMLARFDYSERNLKLAVFVSKNVHC